MQSTTCLALLRYLKDKKDLTIITNSIRLINEFVNSDFKIISTGGESRAHSYACFSWTYCYVVKL